MTADLDALEMTRADAHANPAYLATAEYLTILHNALPDLIALARKGMQAQEVQPVAYLYTLEYGSTVADTKVSISQLNYPFGVCGADYLAKNDDGVSYVRQTPLYAAPTAQEGQG